LADSHLVNLLFRFKHGPDPFDLGASLTNSKGKVKHNRPNWISDHFSGNLRNWGSTDSPLTLPMIFR
jgi:hypothetical protein